MKSDQLAASEDPKKHSNIINKSVVEQEYLKSKLVGDFGDDRNNSNINDKTSVISHTHDFSHHPDYVHGPSTDSTKDGTHRKA